MRWARSIVGKIGGGDEAAAGRDNPPGASELDAFDPPRAREKVALTDFPLAITSTDQRDVIASVQHHKSAQKRFRPFD